MPSSIAIVGMACVYPDAKSPAELWENVLAQRRAFRRIPPERLRLEDYLSEDRRAPDSTYSTQAALIEDYEFDRVKFRVGGSTFRSADLAHWLALDVASRALGDAGFPNGDGLPRDSAGVLLGNTLTGEFSRANSLRLRWPYVRRIVDASLDDEDWAPERREEFLASLEARFKEPFAPVGEETLAGGLSNTIAGRICNHFDLKGGGYTVDGACASSLLAVTNACSALASGDLDVALAGGVDLSLDPFELVGFAKTDALASTMMRVYDQDSQGFWPGEGCGFVVLMRQEDAEASRRRIYATVRGWGVSSDGSGGITRPEVEGQVLAVQRAYKRAGFGIDSVAYLEGHGTGTEVGDATELRTLTRARKEADGAALPAALGSIKANIGHTKAASGVAGLIKTTMALHQRVLPPATACDRPHPILTEDSPALRVLDKGAPWPEDRPLRAGVSAAGFGGINTHVVLEGPHRPGRKTLTPVERTLTASPQDAELFLLGGSDRDGLAYQVEHLLTFAAKLSMSELADLAAELAQTLTVSQARAAVVAASAEELVKGLEAVLSWLRSDVDRRVNDRLGAYLGLDSTESKIGFLFPGQGAPAHRAGGALRRRFDAVQDLFLDEDNHAGIDFPATDVAQPAIVAASVAGMRVLAEVGIEATVAVGHSLGEITALHWAGAMDEASLLRVVTSRGEAMARLGAADGAMASIGLGPEGVQELLNGAQVVVSGFNAPSQTVVSGTKPDVAALVESAQAAGARAVRLPVSHAFHSPLIAGAAQAFAEGLSKETLRSPIRPVASTITGGHLNGEDDLAALLMTQVTSPVRFTEAMELADPEVDLWIEVGPGAVLGSLAPETVSTPVISIDAGGPSLRGLLNAVGAAFAQGAPVNHSALFDGRFTRPFSLEWDRRFFTNPTELAPVPATDYAPPALGAQPLEEPSLDSDNADVPASSALDVLTRLVADWAELPVSEIGDQDHLLTDLHMNSIAVGEVVIEATRHLGQPPPADPTEYANSTVGEVARALEERGRTVSASPNAEEGRPPQGVDSWVRPFSVELVERQGQPAPAADQHGTWQVIAPPGHPLEQPLKEALVSDGRGSGVVVCLPREVGDEGFALLLQGAEAALAAQGHAVFVLAKHGSAGASFARTLHLEAPHITTCVVDAPLDDPRTVGWVLDEAANAEGYVEAHYDSTGTRREPVLQVMPEPDEDTQVALTRDDVLLVTGGGKGIASECALGLAKDTGVRLALFGRSLPSGDAELESNLERFDDAGVTFRYYSVDVTDADAVQEGVRRVAEDLGTVTAFLHGAGSNLPRLIRELDVETVRRTVAPKLDGARNVLEAIDADRLRHFVAFGSIIARSGMRGEADYALANELLTDLVEHYQADNPECRCLALEWSVWSGVGMGERLGRVDALARQGITPISPDAGVSILRELMAKGPADVSSVVVAGRLGESPTLRLDETELPLRRFVEEVRVHYPGVELVVDVELSADTDRYLSDHVYRLNPVKLRAQIDQALDHLWAIADHSDHHELPAKPDEHRRDNSNGQRVAPHQAGL